MRKNLFILLLLSLYSGVIFGQSIYPGQPIGQAVIQSSRGLVLVENHVLCARWAIQEQTMQAQSFQNKETGQKVDWNHTPWFSIQLKDGETLTSNDFRIMSAPQIRSVKGISTSVRRSGKDNGKELIADLYCNKVNLKIHWQVILRDHSNYLRQKFTLTPKDSLKVDQITLLEIPQSSELKPDGIVAGSPWVDNEMFFGFEHPMSHNATNGNEDISFIKRYAPVTSSDSLTYSVAWGVAPKDQLRRAFLYYIERGRAVPYRQFLHYNSWFDSYGAKLNETECMGVIKAYADSLIEKRHTPMQAFLFDDGWDNNQTLWKFNSGFPDGFSNMETLAKKYHSSLGVWMSPFGGYGEDKEQRIKYGLAQKPPFEINANGFSLAGPIYYKRFRDVTVSFVEKYGISIFKIDGVGEGDNSIGSNIFYEGDINALLHLVSEIRNIEPTIYYSLTTGTWASPYWLYYGDAIWRSGGDTGFAGTGSTRQQWITYRDGEAYRNIVQKGPLYPINSLMYHGICIADHGQPATFDLKEQDISDEIWSFFASGTGLQELYINPHKLSSKNWDVLAHAIHWARNNAQTLVDVHWIGGDPESGEVYGRAAWSPHKGIISLRNPTGEIKHFHLDVMKAFEIPRGYPQTYNFRNPRFFQSNKADSINRVKEFDVTLLPYEVKILEATPVK
jgi:hypothetical protein